MWEKDRNNKKDEKAEEITFYNSYKRGWGT